MSENTGPVDTVRAIRWADDCLQLLDQRRLPKRVQFVRIKKPLQTASAIKQMIVRGAPAIGITAAYGVVLAARRAFQRSAEGWRDTIVSDLEGLAQARPTAVNLHWALERMKGKFDAIDGDPEQPLLAEAKAIHEEDIAANHRMGELGAALIEPGSQVITHCNTGSLATGGFGTALGVIRTAYAQDRIKTLYATETRPWLQGARLTAWELLQDNIPASLLVDGAAAYLMQKESIHSVIVGADRITANGDVANMIGTYALAVAAKVHGAKVMVVAPTSTFDLQMMAGGQIEVEYRSADELVKVGNNRVAADGVDAWNPVFDVTPAALIDYIITEKGIIEHPTTSRIAAVVSGDTAS